MTNDPDSLHPLVSIIIPCYNQGQFVAEAIESGLAQTYPHVEVIVINDGSTDGTAEVCRRYGDRIKYIEQTNRGRSAARNIGVQASSGEWLQFLDADDFLHPRKIEWQLQDLIESGAEVGISCAVLFRSSLENEILWCHYPGMIRNMLVALCSCETGAPILIHSVLMRRRTFQSSGGFPVPLEIAEDRVFFTKLACQGLKFHFSPVAGAYYRQHQGSTTQNRRAAVTATLDYLSVAWRMAQDAGMVSQDLKSALIKSLVTLESTTVGRECLWPVWNRGLQLHSALRHGEASQGGPRIVLWKCKQRAYLVASAIKNALRRK